MDVNDLRATWRILLDENLSRAEARAHARAPSKPSPLPRPRPALPCPILPCPALPCPALPRCAPSPPCACPAPSAYAMARHAPTRGLHEPAWCAVPQAKEMLLMAEEAVGDRKLEGSLTLRQLRRYLSSSLQHTGAQQRT